MVIELEDVQRLYEIMTLCPHGSSLYFPIYCTPLFIYTYMFLSCVVSYTRTGPMSYPSCTPGGKHSVCLRAEHNLWNPEPAWGQAVKLPMGIYEAMSLEFEIQDWCLEED